MNLFDTKYYTIVFLTSHTNQGLKVEHKDFAFRL